MAIQASDGFHDNAEWLTRVAADACIAFLCVHTMHRSTVRPLGRLRCTTTAECVSKPNGPLIMCSQLVTSSPVVDMCGRHKRPIRKFTAYSARGEMNEHQKALAWAQQSAVLAPLLVSATRKTQTVDKECALLATLAMPRCAPLAAQPTKTQAGAVVQFVRDFVHACAESDCVYSDVQRSHIMHKACGGLVMVSLDGEFGRPGQHFLPRQLKHSGLLCAVTGVNPSELSLTMATHDTMALTAVDCLHHLLVPLWIEHAGMELFDTAALADIFKSVHCQHESVLAAFDLVCTIFSNTLSLIPENQ